MRFQRVMITVSILFMVLFVTLPNLPAAGETFWKNRFVITELQPVIDQKVERYEQVYMCSEPRVHQVEMEPSPRGGLTKTRVAVRPTKEGSVYLQLDDRTAGYRLYQVFTRGFIQRTLSWAGAEHVFIGSVSFAGYHFHSNASFPLHFKYVPTVGYVHLCGRGTVKTPAGAVHTLDTVESIPDLLAGLTSEDQLTREASCTALGYVTSSPQDRDSVIPALMSSLKDNAMEVRRNAAEALGRISDPRASEALNMALKDNDDWIREVAAHALEQIASKKKEK